MPHDLVILGTRGVPAAHGGFETFAEQLALFLCARGWRVTVYCQADAGPRREDSWRGIRRIHIPATLRGAIGTIAFDAKCVGDVRKRPGVLLTLGYNTAFLCAWLRLCGRVNYINMDGVEWRRAKYSPAARAYLWVNERIAAAVGTRLIADHPAIADRLSGFAARRRIVTIPYGAVGIGSADVTPLSALGLEAGRFFTLIARPEPENSILQIVRTFSRRRRGVRLVVLGRYARERAFEREVLDSASDEVVFAGPVYDRPTLEALRCHSIAYLHGHRVGGTNPSLVEALGAGNAVIAHDNRFNCWVAGEAGCYFSSDDDLDRLIGRMIDDERLRNDLRAAARVRWEQQFTLPMVLGQYERLLAGSP